MPAALRSGRGRADRAAGASPRGAGSRRSSAIPRAAVVLAAVTIRRRVAARDAVIGDHLQG